MMSFTSPRLTISNEGDEWTITTSTTLRTVSSKFKLNEEYDEDMPKGALKVLKENCCVKVTHLFTEYHYC